MFFFYRALVSPNEKQNSPAKRKMFLSYFRFIITHGWEDGRNPACFLLSYFLFYIFVLNAAIEFRGQEREMLIWRSELGSF